MAARALFGDVEEVIAIIVVIVFAEKIFNINLCSHI